MSNDAKKEQILRNLKSQWKSAVISQFKKEPEKVKNSDVDKNTNDIMNNQRAASTMTKEGITREDIFRVLSEIKQEVVNGVESSSTVNADDERRVSCNKCAIYSSCKADKFHTKAGNCPLVKLINASGVNI